MAVTWSVTLTLNAVVTDSRYDLADSYDPIAESDVATLRGAGDASHMNVTQAWHKRYTILTGNTETIDLQDLYDVFGNAVSFGVVTALWIRTTIPDATTSWMLQIVENAANGWDNMLDFAGNGLTLDGQGSFTFISHQGWVVDATHKVFDMTCTGNPAPLVLTVDLFVGGTT